MVDGARALGRSRGPCDLRPYSHGCEGGKTPHHVVPDHCFKNPGRDDYWPGAVPHSDGLCICVDGATKSTGQDGGHITMKAFGKGKAFDVAAHYDALATHGKIHALLDREERKLGKLGDPKNTTSLGEMEKAGSESAAKATGCNAEDLQKQARDHHKRSYDLDEDYKVRADPFGKKGTVDASKMGKQIKTAAKKAR